MSTAQATATATAQPIGTVAGTGGAASTAGGTKPTAAVAAAAAAPAAAPAFTGNEQTPEQAEAELRKITGPGREAESTNAAVQVSRNESLLPKDFDKHTAETMLDTAKSSEKAHPMAYNGGRAWPGAAPLAPKNGFYDERYLCQTKSKEEVGDDDEMEELFAGLDGQGGPTKISLAFKHVDDNACVLIARELKKKGCNCKQLWLNDNKITHKGAKELADALGKNENLTELYLNYNNIGDAGLKHLMGALKSSQLKKLELGCCKLGENESKSKENEAAKVVKLAITASSTIEHIGLFGNDPKMDDDLPEIYEKLAENRK